MGAANPVKVGVELTLVIGPFGHLTSSKPAGLRKMVHFTNRMQSSLSILLVCPSREAETAQSQLPVGAPPWRSEPWIG